MFDDLWSTIQGGCSGQQLLIKCMMVGFMVKDPWLSIHARLNDQGGWDGTINVEQKVVDVLVKVLQMVDAPWLMTNGWCLMVGDQND